MTDGLVLVISLALLGYILLAVELVVIPGFTITGVLGLTALGYAAFLSVQLYGGFIGAGVVAALIVLTTAVLVWFPRSRFGKGVILRSSLEKATAAHAALAVGDEGIADSDLRPAGIAVFGELRLSVVTEGEFIARGSKVVVMVVEGARIVVDSKPQGADSQSA